MWSLILKMKMAELHHNKMSQLIFNKIFAKKFHTYTSSIKSMKIYPAITRKTNPLKIDTVAAYTEFSETLAVRHDITSTAAILANIEPTRSRDLKVIRYVLHFLMLEKNRQRHVLTN